jgi:hypothetical protein
MATAPFLNAGPLSECTQRPSSPLEQNGMETTLRPPALAKPNRNDPGEAVPLRLDRESERKIRSPARRGHAQNDLVMVPSYLAEEQKLEKCA